MTFPQASIFGGSGRRPAPVNQKPIAPPFDPPDSGGNVHTTLPPEQVIPDHFVDPVWMRASFSTTVIPGDYSPKDTSAIIANGGVTITSGRWTGLRIPFLVGANTTPPTMLMTPMLLMYPRDVQDAFLTEQAEKAYDDFVYAPEGWGMPENGFNNTPAAIKTWRDYVRSWGFRAVCWRGNARSGLDAMFHALIDDDGTSFYVHGKEVDTSMTSEEYEASLQQIDRYVGGRLPIAAHFSADADRQLGYPIGFPRDTFLNDWSPYDGRVHLCQQLLGLANDGRTLVGAGTQGAGMYYARRWINLGAKSGIDGSKGPGAPNSRVIAFEAMETAALYGHCTEEYACLRNWELLCGTRDNPIVRPVSGFAGGCRYPDGRCL